MRTRPRSLVGDDRGLSVTEILIASALFMVLMSAVLSMVDSGTKAERGQHARHDALLEVRGAMARVTKDVRQALSIGTDSTPTKLAIETPRTGDQHFVVFEITGGQLVSRRCAALPCVGAATPLASNVTSTTAFCYDPPTCLSSVPIGGVRTIRVSLAVEPSPVPGGVISLTTDVELRNI